MTVMCQERYEVREKKASKKVLFFFNDLFSFLLFFNAVFGWLLRKKGIDGKLYFVLIPVHLLSSANETRFWI